MDKVDLDYLNLEGKLSGSIVDIESEIEESYSMNK